MSLKLIFFCFLQLVNGKSTPKEDFMRRIQNLLMICVFVSVLIVPLMAAAQRPAIVSEVNNPDKLEQYVHGQLDLQVDISDGRAGEGPCLIAVPAGKRLVIEHVSLRANMPPGQKILFARITDTRHFNQYIPVQFQGSHSPTGRDNYVGSQGFRQVVPPEERVCLEVIRNTTDGEAWITWGVSGYYINYP
jgi:hypothetical protein